jgi:hypothetical protein
MRNKPYKVAMVLDREFGNKLVALSRKIHAWVCDSPTNLKVVNKIRKDIKEFSMESGVTNFKVSKDDSAEDMFMNLIDAVDLHHGKFSHSPPWSILEVYGLRLSPVVEAKLHEFGPGKFEKMTNGFIFYREGAV